MPNDLFALLGSSQSASATLVNALLKQLETGEPTPPARPTAGRTILGTLGDALQAMGAVRGGGRAAPLGPFGMQIAGRQALFARQKEEFENRRLQTLEALARLQDAQEQRNISNQFRAAQIGKPTVSMFERVVGGEPHTIRQVLNPATKDVLDEVDLGPKFVAPAVVPGTSGGQEGIFKIPRTSQGSATPVETAPSAGGQPLRPPAQMTIETDPRTGNLVIVDKTARTSKTLTAPSGEPLEGKPNLEMSQLGASTKNILADLSLIEEKLPVLQKRGIFTQFGADIVSKMSPDTAGRLFGPEAAQVKAAFDRLTLESNQPISGQRRLLQAELRLLATSIPGLLADAPTAAAKIRDLRQRFTSTISTLSKQYPRELGDVLPTPPSAKPLSEMTVEELRALRAQVTGQR